jgi:predicted TIM-barrel fold metal-dependent hydrolase
MVFISGAFLYDHGGERRDSMVKAIDFHIHPPIENTELTAAQQAMQQYFGGDERPRNPDDMNAYYERVDMMGVVFGINASTARGEPGPTNDQIADIVKRYNGRFIGLGTVDPWHGKTALREAERCGRELGLRGLKFHPSAQEFFPNDQRFYPIWDLCQQLGMIVLFHAGMTALGAGMPGGGGIKFKYAEPMLVDDIAADFPDLKIVLAHPAFPWQDQQLAIIRHKPNVYMDISGWSPKYFDPLLVQYANTICQDKVLFGSDYPAFTPERWLRDFEQTPFRDDVRPKILLENAQRLLGISV